VEKKLELLHKLLGEVAGEICLCLTLKKLKGGRAAIDKWKEKLAQALKALDEL